MSMYSIQHQCFAVRQGVPETFFEHWWITARNEREAMKIARRIPLDSRRRKLMKVTKIG